MQVILMRNVRDEEPIYGMKYGEKKRNKRMQKRCVNNEENVREYVCLEKLEWKKERTNVKQKIKDEDEGIRRLRKFK